MYQVKKDSKKAKGTIAIKNVFGLMLFGILLLSAFWQIDYYSKIKQIKEKSISFASKEENREETSQNDYICNVASQLCRLLNCPNLETIETDNQQALSLMTENLAKKTSSYLEHRVGAIKKLKETNKYSKAYLFENAKAQTIRRTDLPNFINKSLLKEGGHYVLVQGTIKAYDQNTHKEIHSKFIRELIHLVKVQPTLEKPSSWLANSITSLE